MQDLPRQIKSIGKGRETEEQKIHKLNECQIDALLTKSWITEASRAYIENMPEPRMAYIANRRLFENAFEIAAKNKFQLLRRSR